MRRFPREMSRFDLERAKFFLNDLQIARIEDIFVRAAKVNDLQDLAILAPSEVFLSQVIEIGGR